MEDTPGQEDEASQFQSKIKLRRLCDNLARGKYDRALATLGKELGAASTLDLSRECTRTLKGKVEDIWKDYSVEFAQPPSSPKKDENVPSVQIDIGAMSTTVKASSRIESEEEYIARKAEWMAACERAQEEAVEQHISSTVILVVASHETPVIEQKLRRIPFMNELGRKLFIYDSFCKDPANWTQIKKAKRNAFTGTKNAMRLSQVGWESADTLGDEEHVLGIPEGGGRPFE